MSQLQRFLHLIKNPDGSDTCIWQELRDDEVQFDMTSPDIHCIWARLDATSEPDHCQDADEVRYLEVA